MSLKHKAINSVTWSAINAATVNGIRFTTFLILAKLLAPTDFGLMAMIMAVVELANVFSDAGISNAIIHRQDIKTPQLSTFFWLNIIIGGFIALTILAIRPLVVSFFKQEDLYSLLLYTSLIFVITPFGQLFLTLLKKELRFKTLCIVDTISNLCYAISAIALALNNHGVMSFIMAQIIRVLVQSVLLFFIFKNDWLPTFYFNFHEIKSYLSFGIFQLGERLTSYFTRYIDTIFIGGFLGSTALGYYNFAYQLIMFPVNKLNPIITNVGFPVLAKLQNEKQKFQKGYLLSIKYIAMVTLPLLIGLFLLTSEFITVLDPKWKPAIPILQLFCFVGMIKSLLNPAGSVFLSKGRADMGFYWNICLACFITLAVSLGIKWGINGIATAILAVQIGYFSLLQPFVNNLANLNMRDYLKSLYIPLMASFNMTIALFIIKLVLMKHLISIYLFLGIITLGGLIYLTSCFLLDNQLLTFIKNQNNE